MPPTPPTFWSSRLVRGKYSAVLIPMLAALLYTGGHLLWYLGTPLGRVPVLDEQENITLAEQIALGTLPKEPFYRAPGYALILAGGRSVGISAHGIFPAALILGVLLHALNAGVIARISGRLFGTAAAYAGGLTAAFYPVLVHFSTQALDTVPALTLFLMGIDRLIKSAPGQIRMQDWMVTSLCWAAATLMRPNYFAVWLTLLAIAVIAPTDARRWRSLGAALIGGILFLGLSLWQWSVSGTPGFLPWQGAYNLWAANQPSAHGRYYVQKTILPAVLARQNPARIESILFYQQATHHSDTDIASMNSYWRNQFFDEVKSQPAKWAGFLMRKAYAFCNDWEQYNNKTYEFHRERSPWLFWNPLSFGVIAVLGTAGAFRLVDENRRNWRILLAIAMAYSGSVLLFYVSDRFRLPIAALGIVFLAGAVSSPLFWRRGTLPRKLSLAAGLAGIAFLTFSNYDDVRSRVTFVQDHALLARASENVGDDQLAWSEACAALALQPQHPDALRIAITAYFNQLISETEIRANEGEWLRLSREFLDHPTSPGAPAELRAVAALALWRAGEQDAALAVWRNQPGSPSAIGARVLAGDRTVAGKDLEQFSSDNRLPPLALLAAAREGLPWAKGPSESFPDPAKLAAQLFAPAKSP